MPSRRADRDDRGIDGAHFFGYSLAHYYAFGKHRPGVTNIGEEFEERRDVSGFAKDIIRPVGGPLGVRVSEEGLGSMRGAVGTPRQVHDLIKRYEDVGVDQVIFVSQSGANKHEHVCESLELFAREILPEFAGEADDIETRKTERLADVCAAALARRSPTREVQESYVITAREEPTPAQPRVPISTAAVTHASPPSTERKVTSDKEGEAMADEGQLDISPDAVSPEQFSQLIAAAESDDQIKEVIHSVGTDKTLDRVFEGFEERFLPERAEDVTADVLFVIKDDDQEHSYTVSIKDKTCKATNEAAADPGQRSRPTSPRF